MKYFDNQEQAKELFKRLQEIEEGTKTIFIVLMNEREVKPLRDDLITLLQWNGVERKKRGLRIKGTSTSPSINIVIATYKDRISGKLNGIPQNAIIYI